MAKLKNGILGSVTGKVGSVVGGTWKGVSYIRSLPTKSNKAPSPGQLAQRTKFGMATQLAKQMHPFTKIGYAAKSAKISQSNLLVRQLLRECIKGTYPSFEVNYSSMRLSEGTLPPLVGCQLSSSTANELEITWKYHAGEGHETDQLMVAICCPKANDTFVNVSVGKRMDESAVITLPVQFSSCDVQCYASFVAFDEMVGKAKPEAISNSSWIGSVEIL